MTVPPHEDRESDPSERGHDPSAPLDFDPYRFGRPDNPVPPEYAPHGYVAPTSTPPAMPPPPHGYPPPHVYPPPPPPGYPPYGVTRATNTKATIALVLGILAVVFCFLSILDVVLIVPAIVLGALGRSDAARFPERGGRNAATAGLICGLVAIVLAITVTVSAYHKVKPCIDKYEINSSAYNKCVTDRLFGDSSG
jgi:Domain of unknown function (DUF4190)